MSDHQSALPGAAYEGFCQVEEAGLTGMITLRGDLSGEVLAKAVKSATGCAVPAPRAVTQGKGGRVAWMSPDELLLFCAHDAAPGIAAKLGKALAGEHALVADVSDARAMFRLSGPLSREVMAKLTPANLAPDAFGPGEMRRSRLAQVPAAFHMPDADSFEIICFRSVATYVFDLLKTSAMPGGEVGFWA